MVAFYLLLIFVAMVAFGVIFTVIGVMLIMSFQDAENAAKAAGDSVASQLGNIKTAIQQFGTDLTAALAVLSTNAAPTAAQIQTLNDLAAELTNAGGDATTVAAAVATAEAQVKAATPPPAGP